MQEPLQQQVQSQSQMMTKEQDCLIDTKSSIIGIKRTKKCDWDYDDECEHEESIMNE